MDMATAAGTASVDSPTQQRSDENQRPKNTPRFPPGLPISGDYNKPTIQGAQAQVPPNERDTASTDNDSTDNDSTGNDPAEAFDALLASLESDDENDLPTEHQNPSIGEARPVPSVLLETSPSRGLDDADLLPRRKRYGWNVMKENNRSHLKDFFMFFVGPIQFVMLVS